MYLSFLSLYKESSERGEEWNAATENIDKKLFLAFIARLRSDALNISMMYSNLFLVLEDSEKSVVKIS